MTAREMQSTIAGSSVPRSGPAAPADLFRVTLIGFGNWAQALALALHGARIPINEVVVRRKSRTNNPANRKLVQALGGRLTTLEGATLDAEILWICTPDASISRVAGEIATRIESRAPAAVKVPNSRPDRNKETVAAMRACRRQVAIHSSGALASSELDLLKATGMDVASVHPLMTFPRRTPEKFLRIEQPATASIFPLAGVPFALQGDAAACRAARRAVQALHGVPFLLAARSKPLYHAFGAFTSPLLIALLTAAVETGAAAALDEKQVRSLMRPIVERTIANFFREGPEKSFSGPLARGDADTIARHLAALHQHPSLAATYRQLSLYVLDALPGRKKPQLRKMLLQPTEKAASSGGSSASTA